MKIKDSWYPKVPPRDIKAKLGGPFHPRIRITLEKKLQKAEVVFYYYLMDREDFNYSQMTKIEKEHSAHVKQTVHYAVSEMYQKGMGAAIDPNKADFQRILEGNANDVLIKSLRIIEIYQRDFFIKEWDKTQLQLLNRPSLNSLIEFGNIGIGKKKNEFGLYDLKSGGANFSEKLKSSGISAEELAKKTKNNPSTIHRLMNGETDMSRKQSIEFAQIIGCDPAELLFNDLMVPVWGCTDTLMGAEGKRRGYSVYPGELVAFADEDEQYVVCPREVYRPDVKSFALKGGTYDEYVGFYYYTDQKKYNIETAKLDGEMVVAAVKMKSSDGDMVRLRYFFGIYYKDKEKNFVDLLNIDPEATLAMEDGWDEDHGPEQELAWVNDNRYVVRAIKPEWVAPIIALVNPKRLKTSKDRSTLIKEHIKIYGAGRIQEEILRSEVQQKINDLKAREAEGKAKVDEVSKAAKKVSAEARNLYEHVAKLYRKIELEKEKTGVASKFMPELFKPTVSQDVKDRIERYEEDPDFQALEEEYEMQQGAEYKLGVPPDEEKVA
jgi:transcriptional regulator with XRE-family HTH domain